MIPFIHVFHVVCVEGGSLPVLIQHALANAMVETILAIWVGKSEYRLPVLVGHVRAYEVWNVHNRGRSLEHCQDIFFDDLFVRNWLHHIVGFQGRNLLFMVCRPDLAPRVH